MQSLEPDPHNPWPHDMRITIDTPHSLTYLLFVRAAWDLPLGDVPDVDPVPDPGHSARPARIDTNTARTRWRKEWDRAWSRFNPLDRTTRKPDEETRRLLELPDDQLVAAVSAMPSSFWTDGIDDTAFHQWKLALRDDHTLPLEEHPERICLNALIPAWQNGLHTIIQLPYRGHYAQRVNPATLVVSRTTRHDPAQYRNALTSP